MDIAQEYEDIWATAKECATNEEQEEKVKWSDSYEIRMQKHLLSMLEMFNTYYKSEGSNGD